MSANLFPRCTPEEIGLPSAQVEKYIRGIQAKDLYMHSILMIRNGKCFCEGYWKPMEKDMPHRLYSCSKSFVSVAVGLAIEQGYLKLDDRCVRFFPEYDEEKLHPYLRMMTVRDLLRMASCWTKGSNYSPEDHNWIETFFRDEVSHVPGSVFSYCTSGTTMLCCILKRVTGKQPTEILRPVFDKLGIGSDAFCVQAPVGNGEYVDWGGSGMVLRVEEFAAFANLCMHYGRYNGEHLLPEDYMREATALQIENGLTADDNEDACGYGYQFWRIANNGFAFYGMGGQYAFCYPDEDLMIVTTGYEELKKVERKHILHSLSDCILPCLSGHPLQADDKAAKSLADAAQSLALPAAPGNTSSPVIASVSGKTYKMDENAQGWRSVQFTFKDGKCVFDYENATGCHTLEVGLGYHIAQEFPEKYCAVRIDQKAEKGYKCLVSGAFPTEDTLRIEVQVVDTYLAQLRLNVAFKGNSVTLLGYKHAEWFMDEFAGFVSGTCDEGGKNT